MSAEATGSLEMEVADGWSAVGGGTTPGLEIRTRLLAVTLRGAAPDAVGAALRLGDPPVVARIESDRVLLDLRTVLPEQDAALARSLARLGPHPRP